MNSPANSNTAAALQCTHCGLDCPDATIGPSKGTAEAHQDVVFCCEGCRIVYDMLSDRDLDAYYCATPGSAGRPGNRLDALPDTSDFDYLDDEALLARLLDFRDEELAIVRLTIPGIHCASCVWLLENLYKLDAGVRHAEVNFMRKELLLRYDPRQTSLRAIVELLYRIAYPPEINLASARRSAAAPTARVEWLRLGVAGFCFGNIMLFSFPEYLAGAAGLSAEFAGLFAWLNLALSLPVLLFSAAPFFRSAYHSLRGQNINIDVPIALGILVLFLRSLVDITILGAPGFLDSMAALVFLLLLGRLFQRKTYDRLAFDRDYAAYFPLSVRVETAEGSSSRTLDSLESGDIILIRNGELIPADAVLLSEEAAIDYSFVTGESVPQRRASGDLVYAGGRLTGAQARFQTVKQVSQSYLTDLWNKGVFSGDKHAGFSDLTNRFSKYFTAAIILIAGSAGLYWMLVADNYSAAVDAVTASLIVACPCALALAGPFTFGSALSFLAKRGLYVKNADTLELLASATTVVFDKTGTLTSSQNAEMSYQGIDLTTQQAGMVAAAVAASNHPLSRGVAQLLQERAEDLEEGVIEELPGQGLRAQFYNGHQVLLGSAELLESEGVKLREAYATKQSAAHLAFDKQHLGVFVQSNTLRSGVKAMLTRLRGSFKLFLLSGDTQQKSGTFKRLLDKAFGTADQVHFGQSPHDKLEFLDQLEQAGETTLMVGDGLNDAGALRRSTVGIAVVENTAAFTPASDAILEAEALGRLPEFLAYSRRCLRLVKLCILLSLIYNLVGLTLAVQGFLSPLVCAVLMPLSSITVILVSTLGARFDANLEARVKSQTVERGALSV